MIGEMLGRKKSSASATKEQQAKALKASQVDASQLADKLHKLNTSSASISNNNSHHDLVPKSPNGNGHASPTPIVSRTPSFNDAANKEPSHKFTLASLLNKDGAPKLMRKASHASSQHSSGGHNDDDGAGNQRGQLSRANSQNKKAGGSEKSDKTTGSLLDKYGICERMAIGKGATAVVRLAHKWDRREEKLYAVKEFRKRRKTETEKEYVKKLTSEFCISSTLHHPNIIETVDLVQDEGHHWCEVMEYCPGGDLYAAIKKGNLSKVEGEVYFKQILLGVEYLHGMGVAHRDIKPENLLLDGRGRVKITDFGVSDVFRMCWEKKTHLSKGLCGSEPYIAPEQFEHKEYDARLVDIWACGIVFYCMSLQELPWRLARSTDPTFAQYVQSYPTPANGLQGCPAPITNLSRECRACLKHCLDPDPKNRWVVEEALKSNWLAGVDADMLVKGEKGVATPPVA